jgi:hypothetical protein
MKTEKDAMSDSKVQVRWKKLGELLIEASLINEEQLENGLVISRRNSKKLGETLIDMGIITPKQLAVVLALQCRLVMHTLV